MPATAAQRAARALAVSYFPNGAAIREKGKRRNRSEDNLERRAQRHAHVARVRVVAVVRLAQYFLVGDIVHRAAWR